MANADVQYTWDMGNVRPFVGGTFVYQGKSSSTFGNDVLRSDFFELPSWQTVDVRAGFTSQNGAWKFTVYGRNIFNERVISAANYYIDAYFHLVGKPTIYGASVSYRY
jgi:outer membrane receptor protein involved in Fe transport